MTMPFILYSLNRLNLIHLYSETTFNMDSQKKYAELPGKVQITIHY